MEVYTNYKDSVKKQLQKDGIDKKILADAKSVMRESGQYTEE